MTCPIDNSRIFTIKKGERKKEIGRKRIILILTCGTDSLNRAKKENVSIIWLPRTGTFFDISS